MNRLIQPRFLTAAASAAFVLTFAASVPFAQAASLTSAQIDSITNLLQAFGADASVVANVQAVLSGSTVTTAPAQTSVAPSTSSTPAPSTSTVPSVSGCSTLSNTLKLGSTDDSTNGEVSRLQTLLSKDKSVYPEGLVTGYFGNATLSAVQRWQENRGIVSSGDPESTGYGVVGPHTRAEMDKDLENECGSGDAAGSMNDSSSASSHDSVSSASSTSAESQTNNR